jgi:hypothetical protein
MFKSLKEVRIMTREWQDDYNNERPHRSLKNLPPLVYYQKWLNKELEAERIDAALSTSSSGEPSSSQTKKIVDKVFEKNESNFNQESLILNSPN